jgi:pyruvate kinase
MLSEETSIGKYPAYAVDMMARISLSIEREIREFGLREYYKAMRVDKKRQT